VPIRKVASILAFLAVVAGAATLSAQSDPRTVLEQQLKQTFPLTTFSADKSEVVTAGAVVVLQKDKLMTYAVTSPMPPVNTYKGGKISQGWGGFGRDIAITTLTGGAGTANDYAHQEYVTGQTLWVAQVSVGKSDISFVLVSDPDANNIRYYGQLNIPFHNKNSVPSSDEALKSIAEVLTIQPAQEQQAQGPPTPPTPPGQPQQQQTPLPPLAIPPPPTDAPPAAPRTVTLGEVRDQVIADFGQPQKVVHLGPKEIDYYPNMKVTYTNNKVSDAQ